MVDAIREVPARVIKGHGVASGRGNDIRYPAGTLALQMPFFRKQGLDLSGYYQGTLNLDITPYRFAYGKADFFFEGVDWSPHISPENFLFFGVTLLFRDQQYDGLVYLPDPATKTDHPQPANMLEVMMPRIIGIGYGDEVLITSTGDGLRFCKP